MEDIAPPAEKTTVFKEVTESKWCDQCKKMVSSTSEKALPGADIGLNAMIEMAYLWVMCALSFPKIQRSFHQLQDPEAVDGRHLEDHDSAERHIAAGL